MTGLKTFLKITNSLELHHGLQYHDGLIEDPNPFSMTGSCVPAGIYFTTPEYFGPLLPYGVWIREVSIPEDASWVRDPGKDAWRSNKVTLSPRRSVYELETWKWLVSLGVDVNCTKEPLEMAIGRGLTDIVSYLLYIGNLPDQSLNYALMYAAKHGFVGILKVLADHGADSKFLGSKALSWAEVHGHKEAASFLVSKGAGISND